MKTYYYTETVSDIEDEFEERVKPGMGEEAKLDLLTEIIQVSDVYQFEDCAEKFIKHAPAKKVEASKKMVREDWGDDFEDIGEFERVVAERIIETDLKHLYED